MHHGVERPARRSNVGITSFIIRAKMAEVPPNSDASYLRIRAGSDLVIQPTRPRTVDLVSLNATGLGAINLPLNPRGFRCFSIVWLGASLQYVTRNL